MYADSGVAGQEGGLSDYSDAEALGVMKRILEIKRIVTGEDPHDAGDSRALVPVAQPGTRRAPPGASRCHAATLCWPLEWGGALTNCCRIRGRHCTQ